MVELENNFLGRIGIVTLSISNYFFEIFIFREKVWNINKIRLKSWHAAPNVDTKVI